MSADGPPTVRLAERLLRAALLLYPRDFRQQLGDDMTAMFVRRLERVRAAGGAGGGTGAARRYARRTLAGVALGAFAAQWDRLAPPEALMDALIQDTRYAFRNLSRSRGFTAVAVLSLALGIGANVAIFSVVNAVLLHPLPYDDPDRLMVIWESNADLGVGRYGPSGANFRDWRERSQVFESMMLFEPGSATITDLPEPEQVPAMRVTTNFLQVLGYTPALGRDFLPEESGGGRRNVGIISHGFWQRALGGDPDVIGREMMGDHIPYTIIGVLPEDFWYPLRMDIIAPWDEDELFAQSRSIREYASIGRIRAGASLQDARAEMRQIAAQLEREYPEQEGWTATVVPAAEEGSAYLRPALLVLLGAVAFVLLIACANIANLLLARGTSRQREMAVRAATGASRGRLVLQLLIESGVLAAAGGVLGWMVGVQGVALLRALLPAEVPIPGGVASIQVPAIGVDATVLLFAMVVSVLTGVVFGMAPAWQLSVVDLAGALRASDRSASGGGSAGLRRGLVSAEIALAVVLLIGTLLMVQSFWNLSRVELGFEPEQVLTLQIELPTDSKYQTNGERVQFFSELVDELAATPGVAVAGVSEVLPLDTVTRRVSFRIEGGDGAAGDMRELGTNYNLASASFFDALRVPLLRGEMFAAEHNLDGEFALLVDATFADTYFPGQNPIGRQLHAWGRAGRIIGVVGAVRSTALDARPEPTVYLHSLQNADNMMSVVLRSTGDPESLVQSAKEAVWAIDSEQPVFNVRRMDSVVAARASSPRLTLLLMSAFALVAIVMSALGVYGVMAYAVGQRTHEMGVRQALGADSRGLIRLVLRDASTLVAAGIGVGVVVALLLARGLSALLFDVTPTQPAAYIAVAAALFAVALLASWIPARRAARISPIEALRTN